MDERDLQKNDLMPLITVGIPVYNGGRTLSSCVDSLKVQTYTNLEILIFDNCSEDNTRKIAERAQSADERIRYYLSHKNLGTVHSFSSLLGLAKGEFFMWAAADDLRPPDYVEQAFLHLQANPEASLSAPVTEGYVEGIDQPIYRVKVPDFEDRKSYISRTYMYLTNLPATAIYGLFRTARAKETLGWRRSIATDVAFLFEIALRGKIVSNNDQVLVMNRRKMWNTIEDDYRVFFGDEKLDQNWPPFIQLTIDRIRRASKAPKSLFLRTLTVLLIFTCELRRLAFMTVVKILRRSLSENFFEVAVLKIYWLFIHQSNIEVLERDVYEKRMVLQRYGVRKS